MRKGWVSGGWRAWVVFGALWLCASSLPAQGTAVSQDQSSTGTSEPGADPDPQPTMVPHLATDLLWISGQANLISQCHPVFHSPYSGRNSLPPDAQDATSRVLTLFTGLRLSRTTELVCEVLETGGHGIGEALGLAGFTNLDIVRNPTLSKAPYIARLMWHQVISLSSEGAPSVRTPYSLFSRLPERRLEI